MELNSDDIKHLADLSRVEIQESEITKLADEISEIIKHISEIGEVVTEVTPLAHDHNNVVRDDVSLPSDTSYHEAFLNNAPSSHDGYIKVDQVIS